MDRRFMIRARIAAQNLSDALHLGFFRARDFDDAMADADREFREIAEHLGYRVEKIEPAAVDPVTAGRAA